MSINPEFLKKPPQEQGVKFEMPPIEFQNLPVIDREKEPNVYNREQSISFSVEFKGKAYEGMIEVSRFREANFETANGAPIGRLDLKLYKTEDGERERVSSFKSVLNHAYIFDTYGPKDEQPHLYWNIHNRMISDESLRGMGFGKVNLALMEEGMKKMAQAMGGVQPEWIQIPTRLGALANMIVDREWLAEVLTQPDREFTENSRLDAKADSMGMFHYVPHPKQEDEALRLLGARTQSLDEIPPIQEEVVFIHMLQDHSVDDVFGN